MRHRIFVTAITPAVEVTGEEFHHATRVVRVREGEAVEVFDGKGRAAQGRVAEIHRTSFRVITEGEVPARESPVQIHLGVAIIQLEKFELVLQKGTELGAAELTPLVTDRTEVREERYRGRQERWEKIVLEAVKQSGRSVLPRLNRPARFDEVAAAGGLTLLFDADEQAGTAPASAAAMTVLIGPEGGWSEREIALAREQPHCLFQRLGPRRLRAETAAITALALLTARYGDI